MSERKLKLHKMRCSHWIEPSSKPSSYSNKKSNATEQPFNENCAMDINVQVVTQIFPFATRVL